MLNKAGVIGYPVNHSKSPIIHSYWLNRYSIQGSYEAIEVKPENLREFSVNLIKNGYVGVNVTVPLKEKILNFLDDIDDVAQKIGAVNTVYIKNNKIIGTNTDSYGFISGIKRQIINFDFTNKTALVLGAGGAAKAIVYGLIQSGIKDILIVNRNKQRASDLANLYSEKLKVEDWNNKDDLLSEVDLLINTTILGMSGQEDLDINLDKLPITATVVDIVYKPIITSLLDKAQKRGNKTVDGLWMLLYQAVKGFELFYGYKPEVTDELRNITLK